ncbi:MAG: sigma-70 family RNA polymerase sigma factor [bacterium]|nr:sigma-70 family RNA polymerase sigma factor [bacterium]
MPETPDEDLLLEQAGSGDTQAIASVFESYRERLRRTVKLRMHPQLQARLDASDVLQDTFFEFARRLPDFTQQRPMPLFAWLRRLTIQQLDQLQRKHLGAEKRTAFREIALVASPSQDASVVNLATQLAGQFTSVDRNLLKAEVQSKLFEALSHMEEDEREIIAMRHFEELSTQEIAEILGLTRSGVLKRYTRAIRRLRLCILDDSSNAPY